MRTVANYGINFHQFIDEDGAAIGELPVFAQDAQDLVPLYRAMLLTRSFDEKAVALQRTGRLGTYASSLGQEAVGVGIAAAMNKDDVLLPTFREQSAMLWRGVGMTELLLYWGGDERGSDFADARCDFPVCVPVATHFPHAVGAALAMKLAKNNKVAVAVGGDGATSKGDFYEAINAAGVWCLPVVFVINNNQWAISVSRFNQTAAETLAQKAIAAGIEGVQVDGNDAVAVRHVVAQALERARGGEGASLIEAVTYRLSDHTTADDASRYRRDQEVSQHWKSEPVRRLKKYLQTNAGWSPDDEEALRSEITKLVDAAAEAYLATPPQAAASIFDHLFAELPAALQTQRDMIVAGESPMPEVNMVQAINLALARALDDDDRVVVLGEDVGVNGGVFRATDGLQERFKSDRVMDTPLSEALIAGMSVGMAASGLRPVAEIQFMGFIYPAIDQMDCHASRLRNRTRRRMSCPMVLRAPYGGGVHAPEHHSESTEAMFAHIPGLRVVIPSSPGRAYGLLLAAIHDPDPVVFLEPKRLYRAVTENVEDDGQALPLDKAFVLRAGADITLVTWGAMTSETLEAAEDLASQGIEAEVIDVATLSPFDPSQILASVKKTGRCIIIHEAVRCGGFGAEIAATIAEHGLMSLLAPVKRITAVDTVVPLARLEKYFVPDAAQITAGAKELMEYA